jgi:hypothetical protein
MMMLVVVKVVVMVVVVLIMKMITFMTMMTNHLQKPLSFLVHVGRTRAPACPNSYLQSGHVMAGGRQTSNGSSSSSSSR